MDTHVHVLGLGNMGLPMAANLAAAGFSVSGFDVEASVRAAASKKGVRADDAELVSTEATSADVVLLMLPSSDVVEAVLLGEDGLAAALRPGTLVLDMSSSDPVRTQQLAETLRGREISLVDAPVSGGVKGAVAATLTIMAGGSAADLERAEPVLCALGRVTRAGAVGSGHALKALNNLLSGVSMLASCEAIEVARRFGMADDVVLDVINSSSGRSFSTEFKWPTFIVQEAFNSGFSAALLAKDMRIAVELARELGLPASFSEVALRHWEVAVEQLPGADHTEIDRYAREPHPLTTEPLA